MSLHYISMVDVSTISGSMRTVLVMTTVLTIMMHMMMLVRQIIWSSAQVSSGSDYGVDIGDGDNDDDDDDDGFIWNLLERPGAQMLCFTMNSRLVFKTIEKALVSNVRQAGSAEIELRWTPPTELLSRQG